MALPPYLAVRNRGAAVQVFRVTGSVTAGQLGNDLGGSAVGETAADNVTYPVNRAAQWGDDLYVIQNNDIYKYNSGTGNWDALGLALDVDTATNYSSHSGLYHCNVGGAPRLVAVYRTNANLAAGVVFDGSTWTETISALTYAAIGWGMGFVFRNSLFQVTNKSSPGQILQFDPSGPTFTAHNPGDGAAASAALAVLDNELYLANNDGGQFWLWRFSGSGFAAVQRVASSSPGPLYSMESGGHYVLFPWEGSLIAIGCGQTAAYGTPGAFFCRRLTPAGGGAFTETVLDTTVLPYPELADGVSPDMDGQASMYVCIDNETDPTTPVIHFFARDAGTPVTYSHWQWNGIASLMTSDGGGLTWELAMPSVFGGGDRFWTSGELNARIIDSEPTLGGEKFSLKAFGDPGSDDKIIKFYFSSTEETPDEQATLTGSVTGGSATRNGNQLENVDADGSTTYTCVRDVGTDGLNIGDKEGIMPLIST